jgi:hypothetical protein
MVVIDVEPWKEESEDDRPAKPISQLFGFQDLASDYYQVQVVFRVVEGLPPSFVKTYHFISRNSDKILLNHVDAFVPLKQLLSLLTP